MLKRFVLILWFISVFLIAGCKEEEGTTSLKPYKLEAIASDQIELSFLSEETNTYGNPVVITSFSPTPLVDGESTEITFQYLNETYTDFITYHAPTLVSLVAVDADSIQASFSNGEEVTIDLFNPSPLADGENTEVSFVYDNQNYTGFVTWFLVLELIDVEVIDNKTILASFSNGEEVNIKDFTPNPLGVGEITIQFQYSGKDFTYELTRELDEVNVRIKDEVNRTVDPGQLLSGNLGVWVTASQLDRSLGLIANTGPNIMRFPGGNISNNYCWKTEYKYNNDFVTHDDWSSWAMNIDDYIAFIKELAVVPMYSVNPFSHEADGVVHDYVEEAVDLVKKFKENGFNGAYYEVGNENEGSWNPMLTMEEYTNRFILLAEAIKAEDPSAKMMGPVIGEYKYSLIKDFLDRLIAVNKLYLLDYISFHDYPVYIPSNSSSGISLVSPAELQFDANDLRSYLDSHGGQNVKIAITEYNAAIWADGVTKDQFTMKQALWTANYMGELFNSQIDLATIWITLHPGTDPHSLIDSNNVRPTKNYWVPYLVSQIFSSEIEVDVLKTSPHTVSYFNQYAVKKADGSWGIMIINKNNESKYIHLSVEGFESGQIIARTLTDDLYHLNNGSSVITCTQDVESNLISFEIEQNSIVFINLNEDN